MQKRDPMTSPWPEPPEGRPPTRQDSGFRPWPLIQGLMVLAFLGFILHEFSGTPTPPADRALSEAVSVGDLGAARRAIEQGGRVRQTDLTGSTPLHTAAWRGDLAMARLLLEQGADVNAADTRSGETPLISAARGGQADMVTFLLERGADPDHRTHADSPQCNGIVYPAGVDALAVARQGGQSGVAERLAR